MDPERSDPRRLDQVGDRAVQHQPQVEV
jgi:hypothetical protein